MIFGRYKIRPGDDILVIAALTGHGGSRDAIVALIDAAASSGAAAVSLHCTGEAGDGSPDPPLALDTIAAAITHARQRGIAVLAGIDGERSVAEIEPLAPDAFRVGNGTLGNRALITAAARTARPLFLCAGRRRASEVAAAVGAARAAGGTAIVLMHCATTFPAARGSENLRTIASLSASFRVPIGYADHGSDPLIAPLALACGACLYEKALAFAPGSGLPVATPDQLASIVHMLRRAHAALGELEMPSASRRAAAGESRPWAVNPAREGARTLSR